MLVSRKRSGVIARGHMTQSSLERSTSRISDRISYRVAEAAHVSGLSRSTIYELIAAGKIRDIKVAGCRIIPAEDLLRLIAGSPTDA